MNINLSREMLLSNPKEEFKIAYLKNILKMVVQQLALSQHFYWEQSNSG